MEHFLRRGTSAKNDCYFTEAVYADDLNAYRLFTSSTPNKAIKKSMQSCQRELHKWGAANQVFLDPAEESMHIMSVSEPGGDDFKLLGVTFDTELSMEEAVSDIVVQAGWKLRTLLRTRRFYKDANLIISIRLTC